MGTFHLTEIMQIYQVDEEKYISSKNVPRSSSSVSCAQSCLGLTPSSSSWLGGRDAMHRHHQRPSTEAAHLEAEILQSAVFK